MCASFVGSARSLCVLGWDGGTFLLLFYRVKWSWFLRKERGREEESARVRVDRRDWLCATPECRHAVNYIWGE